MTKDTDDTYWDITKNFKEYPRHLWFDSTDVACFGVPCEEGLTIMLPFDAAAFVAANDISSMIALRIPQADWDKLQAIEDDSYDFELKDSYFVDYKGKTLI